MLNNIYYKFMLQTVVSQKFIKDFKLSYQELYKLHPNQSDNLRLRYLNQNWFFPHHLNCVLWNVISFQDRYFPTARLDISLFGALFHDAGLVFERKSADPRDHESRSVKYTSFVLTRLGYSQFFIRKVNECIEATEFSCRPKSKEAFLVRNADGYAHFATIHFFAKANFAENMDKFVTWFSEKVSNNWQKLTIKELQKDVRPLYDHYLRMIEEYQRCKDEKNFLNELFK